MHNVVPEHARRAGVRPQQCRQDPQGGCLSGAVGTEHAVDAAAGDRQADAVDCLIRSEPLAEAGGLDGEIAAELSCAYWACEPM